MAESRALPSMLLLVIALLLAANLFRGEDSPSSPNRAASLSTGRLEQATARLAAAVEKLDNALARQPATVQEEDREPPTGVVVPHPTRATVSAPLSPLPRPRELGPKNEERLRELRPEEREGKEIMRVLAFRTWTDILEEYGFPDEIWPGGNQVRFHYRFVGANREDYALTFTFQDGLLMQVDN